MAYTTNQRLKEVVDFLIAIKKVYNQKNFAEQIGKSKSQLSEMLKGTLVISERTVHNITKVFPEIDYIWLLTGEGEMINPPRNPFSQMSEKEIEDTATDIFREELMKLYESGEIFSAKQYHGMIAEKDKRIEELQRRIWELEQESADKKK